MREISAQFGQQTARVAQSIEELMKSGLMEHRGDDVMLLLHVLDGDGERDCDIVDVLAGVGLADVLADPAEFLKVARLQTAFESAGAQQNAQALRK